MAGAQAVHQKRAEERREKSSHPLSLPPGCSALRPGSPLPTSILPSRPVPLRASHILPRVLSVSMWRTMAPEVGIGTDLHLFRLGIERDHRAGPRLAVPDAAVGADRNAIGTGLGRWRLPLAHLPRFGIERAEVSATIVGVPHGPVAPDLESPRTSVRGRQRDLAHPARRRIDVTQLVRAEHRDPDGAVGCGDNPVGDRIRRGHLVHHRFPGRGIEIAVTIVVRVRKPDLAIVKDRGVRILRGVRKRILRDLPGFRIHPSQESTPLARVPDASVGGDRESVRARARGGSSKVDDLAGLRIEVPDVAVALIGVPDASIGRDRRVVRKVARTRNHVLGDGRRDPR